MKPKQVYACFNINNEIRMSSSSGGVFSSFAEYVFSNHGVVYGVAMTEDCYSAEFIAVTDKDGLSKLLGSKYLQAKVGNTFKNVRKDLQTGKIVLFTGTGCQINGLKYFLGKDYDNLICVDVICHGVPSPSLWKMYVKYQEEKNGGKLKYINFRCKDNNWNDFGMKKTFKDIYKSEEKQLYISKDQDSYMQMFLRDYCLRPSCYECAAKKVKMSDLTIADFWGIKDIAPEMNDGMGTSLVLVRTNKGQMVFDNVRNTMKVKEVSYEDSIKNNPAEYKSSAKPIERKNFYVDMHNISFEELKIRYASPIKYSCKIRIKRKIKSILKRILGGGRVSNTEYGLLFLFESRVEKW